MNRRCVPVDVATRRPTRMPYPPMGCTRFGPKSLEALSYSGGAMPEEREERAVKRRLTRKTRRVHAVAERRHTCPHCLRAYAYRYNMLDHVRRVHEGKHQRPICEECGKSFSNRLHHEAHVTREHTANPSVLRCPFPGCGRRFMTKVNLRAHKRVHNPNRPRRLQCSYCPYAARTRCILDAHVANIHPPPEGFPCEHCEYIGRNRACLQRHVRSAHEPAEEHQCSHCGATYASRSALRKHEVYHTKRWRWHRCTAKGCRKKFKSIHELRIHEKGRHSKEEDRIACPTCGLMFKHVLSLNGHIAHAHPRAEGYRCCLCGHIAYSRPRLREHVLEAHSESVRRSPSRGRSRSRSRSMTRLLTSRTTEDWGERVSVAVD